MQLNINNSVSSKNSKKTLDQGRLFEDNLRCSLEESLPFSQVLNKFVNQERKFSVEKIQIKINFNHKNYTEIAEPLAQATLELDEAEKTLHVNSDVYNFQFTNKLNQSMTLRITLKNQNKFTGKNVIKYGQNTLLDGRIWKADFQKKKNEKDKILLRVYNKEGKI